MADPTTLPGTLQQIWDDMEAFGEQLVDHNDKARFASYKRYFMILAMQSAFAGTPEAITFMEQNRRYLKNSAVSDITIEGDGQEWVFPAGVTYACSPDELAFFLGKVQELSIVGLNESDFTNWVAFAPQSYFWS